MPMPTNNGVPGNEFCDVRDKGNDSPTWSSFHLAIRYLVPESIGGGAPFRSRFKTAFVIHNRLTIIAAAHANRLPVELVAGVAWVEVAGKPTRAKEELFHYRSIRDMFYSGGKPADRTSFGFMSMQIRAAAETLGIDPSTLKSEKQVQLAMCLEGDAYSINLAAKHLRMLADHDGFAQIGDDEVRVIGARYNQGTQRALEQVKKDLTYGNFIVRNWHAFTIMLSGTSEGVVVKGAVER